MSLSTIRRIVAITSCKGGVGKSTVSLELARRLAARGRRVGLFDADVHGPSLPTQLDLHTDVVTASDGYSVLPLEHDGLRLMSFGWLSRSWNRRPEDDIRLGGGGRLCPQLLHTTRWGDLDYLIVDSPPGTGDIPTGLYTKVPLHGAVVVTMPSTLATADVVRGLRLLTRSRVPVLAVVENMATFTCNSCATVHHPFGRGHLEAVLSEVKGAPPFALSLPIVAAADASPTTVEPAAHALSPFVAAIDDLAGALEETTAGATAVQLPHKLGVHEQPHWPTEMAIAEIGL